MAQEVDRIFLYGTLRYAPLLTAVAGDALPGQAAVLRDHKVCAAEGEIFPLIKVAPGEQTPGIVVTVSKDAMARMDFYEMGFGYAPTPVEIEVGSKREAALVYLPEPGRWKAGGNWSLDAWMGTHGELSTTAALDYMRLCGVLEPDEAAVHYAQIRMRAASQIRAGRTPRPRVLGKPPSTEDILVSDSRQPYLGYFAVREDDLTFPKFRGGQSAPVTRAAFMGGDAVTVLPYDPVTDSVLVVRQFRFGAYARGDTQPWCTEPVAGRIDPGETPEEAVRREAREEAGLELGPLFPVARYYPSPAAYSEFLFSFVAPTDLSRLDGRVSGVSDEAEDIQSRVIPLEALLGMVATGEADTGPLVLSAYWLLANRERVQERH